MKEDYEVLLAAVMPDPAEPAYHLTNAEVRGYVRNDLDEVASESAESHLAVCAECLQAADALRTAASGYPAEKSFGKQNAGGLSAFLTAQARPLMFAGLLLVIIGTVLLALFFGRKRESQPPANAERVKVATPSPPVELRVEQAPKAGNTQPETQSNTNTSTPSVSNRNDGNDQSPRTGVPRMISPSMQREIMLAAQTGRLERPRILAELGGTNAQLLSDSGDGQPFQLLGPVGQVLDDRIPTFRWQAVSGAGSYQVTITDHNLDEVATSGQVTNTEWKASQSLKPGAIYSWQVTAFKNGSRITSPVMPAPQARFKILDRKQSEQLRRLKRVMPDYHLGLGVLYAQAGLLDEAELEFQQLLKDKNHAELAEKLLSSVRSMKK